MTYVVAAPELLEATAAQLESIGSELNGAHAAAAVSTTGLVLAAADEVSTAVTALFAGYGKQYQALMAQAGAFHQRFVQALNSGAARMRPPRRPTFRRCGRSSKTCWARSMHPPRHCWGVR